MPLPALPLSPSLSTKHVWCKHFTVLVALGYYSQHISVHLPLSPSLSFPVSLHYSTVSSVFFPPPFFPRKAEEEKCQILYWIRGWGEKKKTRIVDHDQELRIPKFEQFQNLLSNKICDRHTSLPVLTVQLLAKTMKINLPLLRCRFTPDCSDILSFHRSQNRTLFFTSPLKHFNKTLSLLLLYSLLNQCL